jgi:phospholipid-transporting ATPase
MSRWGYAVSLAPMILVQMIKDAVEDLMRLWDDRRVNNQKAQVYARDGSNHFIQMSWKNILVGDIVRVEGEDLIPADMAILYAKYGDTGDSKCYVETSQLDGETNLKQRNALGVTQKICSSEVSLSNLSATIECDRPNKSLYSFTGALSLYEQSHLAVQTAILYENILLRGTRLKNTHYVYGVVIYTGPHTKLLMNNSVSPHKRTKMEYMINLLVVLVFSIQLSLALICAGISTFYNRNRLSDLWYFGGLYVDDSIRFHSFYQGVVVFFLLFNNFVPIGLLASLEFIKLGLSRFFIDRDKNMVDSEGTYAHANTSNMPEELGQIRMIFSDKTGTLTKNKMTFKKFWLPESNQIYGQEDVRNRSSEYVLFGDERVDRGQWRNETNDSEFFNLFLILSLCQTVLPEHKDGDIVYQASSPDELTLVTFAKEMGFEFIGRTERSLTLAYNDPLTQERCMVRFELLNTLHFNSFRKRMSVVVRVTELMLNAPYLKQRGQILVLTKGADDVMLRRVSRYTDFHAVERVLFNFATEGLRTLICARKELSEDEYNAWHRDVFTPANLHVGPDRQRLMDAAAEALEFDLYLTGVTAIDDELQDEVANTIEQLRKAGIKFFMLTGDKQETAITIAQSCSLLTNTMHKIIINTDGTADTRDAFIKLRRTIEKELETIENTRSLNPNFRIEYALIISGPTLDILFDKGIRHKSKVYTLFMQLCMECKSVICARSSPSQKSKIVSLAKKYVSNNRTLAIGDGANDVPMIQVAHVGVGISGKEGLQASRSADFSIGEFRFLERLLLIHGRNNYRRIAKFILHTTYKNIANQIIQFYFAFFSLFGGKSVHLSTSLVLYNLLFTLFPMVSLAFFDQEVSMKKNLAFPELYREGLRDYYINLRVIVIWLINGFYQGAICFFIPLGMYYTGTALDQRGYPIDFNYFSTIVSTAVLLVVTYKVILETNTWNPFTIISVVTVIPLWFAFLCIFTVIPKSDEFYYAFFYIASSGSFWLAVFLSSTIAVLWDVCWKSLVRVLPLTRRLYHCVQDLPESMDKEEMRLIASREFDLNKY